MSSIGSIVDAIKTALAGINGAGGGYTHTLTATGQVQVASVPGEGQVYHVPSVYIYDWSVETVPGTPLPAVTYRATIRVMGFVAATTSTEEALLKAAWDLAADIHKAVLAQRSPTISGGAVVHDIVPQSDATPGGQVTGYAGMGISNTAIQITYRGPL
jgi:hypothetical protein